MSPIRIVCASLLLLALGLPTSQAGEQRGSYTQNKRWGYKVRAPKKWKSRAIRLDERWIAGKFFPDYSLRARNDMKQFVQAKPDLWVIGFPHEREKERTTVERPDENTVIITVKNPYKDYKDFVQRESWATTGAGGWYFSREEKIQHNDIDVDVYEIKVEKLVVAPMRVVTWVYHLADVDFAVQVRILEAHYEENKSVIAGVMKSFREIPRTEPFPEDDDSSGTRMGGEEGEVLFVEEINAQRTRKVEARIERELKHLPRDWRCKKSKHFVILGPKDKRYTMPMNYVMNFAVEIRKYLEKNFADLGPSEVPRGLELAAASAGRVGRPIRAKRLFKEAIEAGSDDALTFYRYGDLLENDGKTDKAIEMFRKAIELGPLEAEFYAALGRVIRRKGDKEDGLRYMKLSLELDPDNPWLENALERYREEDSGG